MSPASVLVSRPAEHHQRGPSYAPSRAVSNQRAAAHCRRLPPVV